MKRATRKHLIVLAGGFGTRLRSAVSDVPKPLAPVVDRPFLHYLIETWVAQGVTELTFLLHHQAELIEDFVAHQKAEGRFKDCEVRIVTEPQPLGTGGAIAHAIRQIGESGSFLVTNADTWLGTGIKQVHAADAPAIAIVRIEDAGRYGKVEARQERVIAFEEKQDGTGSGWINAGLYHLHADVFRDWDGKPFSVERILFPVLVAAGRLQAVPLQTEFIDIGIPDDYHRFCRWIDTKKTGVL